MNVACRRRTKGLQARATSRPGQRIRSSHPMTFAFRSALSAIMSDVPERETYEQLLARFNDSMEQTNHVELVQRGAQLEKFLKATQIVIAGIATSRGLSNIQTAQKIDLSAVPPFAQLALVPRYQSPTQWVTFRFELRGPGEVAMRIDGEEVWRGGFP